MRKRNSCRFDTYYKIEVWNETICCWTPIQRSYPTEAQARQDATGKFRILEISERGKQILESEIDADAKTPR